MLALLLLAFIISNLNFKAKTRATKWQPICTNNTNWWSHSNRTGPTLNEHFTPCKSSFTQQAPRKTNSTRYSLTSSSTTRRYSHRPKSTKSALSMSWIRVVVWKTNLSNDLHKWLSLSRRNKLKSNHYLQRCNYRSIRTSYVWEFKRT